MWRSKVGWGLFTAALCAGCSGTDREGGPAGSGSSAVTAAVSSSATPPPSSSASVATLRVVPPVLPQLPDAADVDLTRGPIACTRVDLTDLGGLGLPVIECDVPSPDCAPINDPASLHRHTTPIGDLGCRGCGARGRAFVVVRNGKPQLMKTKADAARTFAPIDSEAKALSFAVLLTGEQVNRDPSPKEPATLRVQEIEASFVKKVTGGYLVRLFDGKQCGCGQDFLAYGDYLVEPDGTLTRRDGGVVYDVLTPSSCID